MEFKGVKAIPNFQHHSKDVVYKETADELLKTLQMVDRALEGGSINGLNSLFHRQVRNSIKKALNK